MIPKLNPELALDASIVAFSKAIARTLKKYTQSKNTEDQCPNCEEGKLVREEGCYKCYTCFYSKC